ncbi:MAG: GNAT family N-acetyltransferase [Anaerolineae bacterium]|nr:GNAT family N-acetyltransferase [Anaerolineae bacterium]
MNVLTEPRSTQELETILIEVNNSPHIGEITLEEMETFIQKNTIRFYYENEQFMGFGAWVIINAAWIEVGPLYVAQAARSHGIGRQITEDVIMQNKALNQYAVTRNPPMKHIFMQQGFRAVSLFRLPFVVQRFLVSKIRLRKLLRFASKRSPESVSHLIRLAANT